MKENNLLASVAVFGELYNSKKYTGVSSILGEFILGAVAFSNKLSFTSSEIKALLLEIYDFNIIESVVRHILITTLKTSVEFRHNLFHFDEDSVKNYEHFKKEIAKKNESKNTIFLSLVDYVNSREKIPLSEEGKTLLFDNFTRFLFNNDSTDKFSNHISAFIIKNEGNTTFLRDLNLIKEGVILYQGLRFSNDTEGQGAWKEPLSIYLNTEYLFSAVGFHGIIYQEIFEDFNKLVNEINEASKKQNGKELIQLKYLPDTRTAVEHFFISAESIKNGTGRLEPGKTAMKTIVDSCQTPSDVVSLKADFFVKIAKLGIIFDEFNHSWIDTYAYNVEDLTVLDDLRIISLEKRKTFDEESCLYFFQVFTKINFLRKGVNDVPFHKVRHVLMTESGFGKYLGHHNLVKFSDVDASFTKDIDFITARFWFALNKGFSDTNSLPKSFDVLTKAKIILASHINNSITDAFNKLVRETKEGKLSREEALARSQILRTKPNKPEEVSKENVDSTFDFLNNDEYLDEIYREKVRKDELYQQTLRENQELRDEINRRDVENERKRMAEELERRNKEKENFISRALKIENTNDYLSLIALFVVFLLNTSLISFAVLIGISADLKRWLADFGIFQIIILVFYVIAAILEIIGRSYLFNKVRIKSGWTFILSLFKKSGRKELISQRRERFSVEFEEINSKH